MKKYEYDKLPTTIDNLITRLNFLGKEGWKIVVVLRDEFILMREVETKSYDRPMTRP